MAIFLVCCNQDSSSDRSSDLVEKCIGYHDPNNAWPTFAYQLHFEAVVADGSKVTTTIEIDNSRDYFRFIQDEAGVDLGILGDSCFNLKSDSINCDRIRQTRDYWLYLWGLPMKWRDPGVQIDSVITSDVFEGIECHVIRIPYEKDVWYFYIDKSNHALRGEVFYVDEEKNVGEKLIRSGEVNVGGIILPEKRAWYYTHEPTYLATDHLVKFEALKVR